MSLQSANGDRGSPAACASGFAQGSEIGKAGAGNKPGSVEDNHSSRTTVTGRLQQPTRESARDRRCGANAAHSPIWSCSGRGLPCRGLLPAARCALTAPFHPYRASSPAVCFLWHFPWARALQGLPGALSEGARTFLCSIPTAIVWPTPAFSAAIVHE